MLQTMRWDEVSDRVSHGAENDAKVVENLTSQSWHYVIELVLKIREVFFMKLWNDALIIDSCALAGYQKW